MDTNILAALRERSKYRQLRSAVPDSLLGAETIAMLGWFGAYFQNFPDKEYVETDVLRSLFTLRASTTATPDQLAVMKQLINRLDDPVDPGVLDGITSQLYERDFAGQAAAILRKFEDGDEVDVTYELNRLASGNMRRMSAATPSTYIDAPIEDILADFSQDRGLKMPTQLLRDGVAGLQGGDLILVAGRPDKGKTSLLASMLTGFAPQLRELGWAGRPMLWANNEGSGRRIIPRIYQAALNVDFPELTRLSNNGTLKDLYLQAVDGQDIRVKDCHGMSIGALEQTIEEMNPCVGVFDMMANFKGARTVDGNKTDSVEAMWQEVREICVRHNMVGIGTIQISDLGDDMMYPGYNALKDSRTGVQGAVDVMLMMGAKNSPDMASVRGLSTPKNKRQMPGKPSHIQGEVYFDSAKCQFEDGND